jgi:hypothetical protein
MYHTPLIPNLQASGSRSLDGIAASMLVTRDDIRSCKREALKSVKVPQSVIQLITDLRTYLQVWIKAMCMPLPGTPWADDCPT